MDAGQSKNQQNEEQRKKNEAGTDSSISQHSNGVSTQPSSQQNSQVQDIQGQQGPQGWAIVQQQSVVVGQVQAMLANEDGIQVGQLSLNQIIKKKNTVPLQIEEEQLQNQNNSSQLNFNYQITEQKESPQSGSEKSSNSKQSIQNSQKLSGTSGELRNQEKLFENVEEGQN